MLQARDVICGHAIRTEFDCIIVWSSSFLCR